MTYQLNIVREVDDTFVKDTMVTMVENAYHWFIFENIKRDDDLNILEFDVSVDEEYAEGDDDLLITKQAIGPKQVVETIQEIISSIPPTGAYQYIHNAVAENDAGDIDADAADLILQHLVFGETIFG